MVDIYYSNETATPVKFLSVGWNVVT